MTVTAAQDAQSSGYGDKSYWDYLDASAQKMHDHFAAQGLVEMAEEMLTRSLSAALAGNDGV